MRSAVEYVWTTWGDLCLGPCRVRAATPFVVLIIGLVIRLSEVRLDLLRQRWRLNRRSGFLPFLLRLLEWLGRSPGVLRGIWISNVTPETRILH